MRLAAPVLSGYLLRKEARERAPSSRQTSAGPPVVCKDLVVQNALYTGNLEAVKAIFSRGFPSDLIVQPQGGAMRWVSSGKVRGTIIFETIWLCDIKPNGRPLGFCAVAKGHASPT